MRWLIFSLILLLGVALGMGLYTVPPASAEPGLSAYQPAPQSAVTGVA